MKPNDKSPEDRLYVTRVAILGHQQESLKEIMGKEKTSKANVIRMLLSLGIKKYKENQNE